MTLSVDDMLRLAREMGQLGVVAFEAGEFKVSFSPGPMTAPVPLQGLEELGDEEDDLYFSSDIRPRSE